MTFYLFSYWYDHRLIGKVGGPIKVFELANHLHHAGHHLHLFMPRLGYPERQTQAMVHGIPLADLPILRPCSYGLLSFFAGLRQMIHDRPDVVYVRYHTSPFPALVAKAARAALVVEANDDIFRQGRFRRGTRAIIDRFTFHHANLVLTTTPGLKEKLALFFRVPARKIATITSGSNTALFRPLDKMACRRELGLDVAKSYVGFVGTFFAYQGVDILIRAAPEIVREQPDAHFLVVGDGPMKSAWQEEVKGRGLEKVFHFPGLIPYAQVPAYIGAMDVAVAPFRADRGETSPVKIFDYLACARPVVASEIPALVQLDRGIDGMVLVPPEQPQLLAREVSTLLRNPESREQLGGRGRETVCAGFTWRMVAERTAALCRDCARGR